jgi:hypothetical protein
MQINVKLMHQEAEVVKSFLLAVIRSGSVMIVCSTLIIISKIGWPGGPLSGIGRSTPILCGIPSPMLILSGIGTGHQHQWTPAQLGGWNHHSQWNWIVNTYFAECITGWSTPNLSGMGGQQHPFSVELLGGECCCFLLFCSGLWQKIH